MPNPQPIPSVQLPRVAPLAIVALLVALIPLCPPLNVLGVLLGMMAMRQIARARAAGGHLRGRGTAIAAIMLGLIVGAGSWWAWGDTARWMDREIRAEVMHVSDVFFNEIVKQDAASSTSLKALWAVDGAPDAEAIATFGAALQNAGPVIGVQVEPPTPVQGLSSDMQAWVLLKIPSTGDQLLGGVVMSVEFIGAGLPTLIVRLKSVGVHLPGGDITLPWDAVESPDAIEPSLYDASGGEE